MGVAAAMGGRPDRATALRPALCAMVCGAVSAAGLVATACLVGLRAPRTETALPSKIGASRLRPKTRLGVRHRARDAALVVAPF